MGLGLTIIGWFIVAILLLIFLLKENFFQLLGLPVSTTMSTTSKPLVLAVPVVRDNSALYTIGNSNNSRSLRSKYNFVGTPETTTYQIPRNINNGVGWPPVIKRNGGPRRRALIIGIDYEGKDYELYGCVNDAKNMHALMRNVYHFDEILIMTDHTPVLPTRANMLKAFRWLVSDVEAGDSLALHYSGHGDLQKSFNSHLKHTGYDDTIVPLDWEKSGQILDDDLFKYLVLPLQHKGCLTATFDCCHSGTGLDLKKNYQVVSDSIRRMGDDPRPPVPSNVVLYSACLDNQTADDTSDENGSYGTLTHALLQVLAATNYRITHRALLTELQRVIKKTSIQKPQLSSERDLHLDSFFSFVCAENQRV